MPDLALPLSRYITDATLLPVAEKVLQGKRLSFEDGLLLYGSRDLAAVGALAHHVRTRMHGRHTGYVQSRRLSCTNICGTGCRFCAFHAEPGDPKGYVLSAEEAVRELGEAGHTHVRELHITSGHHPELTIDYFEHLFRSIKAAFPALHLKAFTMVELVHYARVSGLPVEDFLDRCVAAGLESCPGGGAEIFDAERARARSASARKDANVWLRRWPNSATARASPPTAPCSNGHIEQPRHRVDHLLRLRALQDRTGGFLAYIPLAYQAGDNPLARACDLHGTTAVQDLREVAVARLLLDNIPHIKGLLGDDLRGRGPGRPDLRRRRPRRHGDRGGDRPLRRGEFSPGPQQGTPGAARAGGRLRARRAGPPPPSPSPDKAPPFRGILAPSHGGVP